MNLTVRVCDPKLNDTKPNNPCIYSPNQLHNILTKNKLNNNGNIYPFYPALTYIYNKIYHNYFNLY